MAGESPRTTRRRAPQREELLLEDGTRFDGVACGADGVAVGEVVFTTSMSGYQEAVTDPSFAGQLITFTAPHVGNYGVGSEAMESDRIHARAAIMRAAVNREDAPGAEGGWLDWLHDCGIPAISGVDTRALVRHIRDARRPGRPATSRSGTTAGSTGGCGSTGCSFPRTDPPSPELSGPCSSGGRWPGSAAGEG